MLKPDIFLFNPEWQGSCANNDVYHGAHGILENLFPEARQQNNFLETPVAAHEKLQKKNHIWGLDVISQNFQQTLNALQQQQPDCIFMIAGSCGAEAAPIAYLNKRYNGQVAIIWCDAHADINLPQDSASGYFHGMVLRTLMGDGPVEFTNHISTPVIPTHIFYVGLRDKDSDEIDYIEQHNIPVFSLADAQSNIDLCRAIRKQGLTQIYIHLDVDMLNPIEFPNSLMPVPHGPALENTINCFTALQENFDVIGFSVVEHTEREPHHYEQLKGLLDVILT